MSALLDDIITLAEDDRNSLPNLLRKCLRLASELKNERLKTWANQELDGYDTKTGDELPKCPRRGFRKLCWAIPRLGAETHHHSRRHGAKTQALCREREPRPVGQCALQPDGDRHGSRRARPSVASQHGRLLLN